MLSINSVIINKERCRFAQNKWERVTLPFFDARSKTHANNDISAFLRCAYRPRLTLLSRVVLNPTLDIGRVEQLMRSVRAGLS